MTSHFEAYTCAITEQEIGTKDSIYRREKLHQQTSGADDKCRLCKKEEQDLTHFLISCSKISSRYYLPLPAKYVYEKSRKKSKLDLLIWRRDANTCKIVEFSCPVDVNVAKKILEKEENLVPSYVCYK